MKHKSNILLLIFSSFILARFIFALPSTTPTSGTSTFFSNGTSPATTTSLTLNYANSTAGTLALEQTSGSSLEISANATTGSIIIPSSSTLNLKSGDTPLLSIDGGTGATSTVGATNLIFKGILERGSSCEKVAFPWKYSSGIITLQDITKKVFFGPAFTSSFTPTVQVNSITELNDDIFITKGSFDGLFSDKAYETSNLNDLTARRGRVWGQGRTATTDLVSSAGECTKTLTLLNADGTNSATTNTIKISRSKVLVSWDGAGAGCPKNWWVCTRGERRTNVTAITPSSNLGACGTGLATIPNFYYLRCNGGIKTPPLAAAEGLLVATADDGFAWLADPYNGSTALDANGFNEGAVTRQDGTQYTVGANGAANGTASTITTDPGDLCNYRPVWCCSY